MLAALGAKHPQRRAAGLGWCPRCLLAGEGCVPGRARPWARQVTPWVVFALLAAVIVRHVDLACRARGGPGHRGRRARVSAGKAGCCWPAWPPRPGSFRPRTPVLSGYLWLLFIWDFLNRMARTDGAGIHGPGNARTETTLDRNWSSRRARAGGCGRTRTRCPRPCCRSTARSPSWTSRCATWAAVGLRDIVIVVGYVADAVRDRAAALEHEHGVRLTLVGQRPSRGVEQRLLALAGPRALRERGALLVNGDTVQPRLGREDAARRGRANPASC